MVDTLWCGSVVTSVTRTISIFNNGPLLRLSDSIIMYMCEVAPDIWEIMRLSPLVLCNDLAAVVKSDIPGHLLLM